MHVYNVISFMYVLCRPVGFDIGRDELVLGAGERLGPAQLGLLATVGITKVYTHNPPPYTYTHIHPQTLTPTHTHTQVKVFQCPSIGVLSTGNEVIEPGQPLLAGQIYDSNRTTLIAAVKEQGLTPLDLGIARDEYVTISTCDVCVCE